MVKSDETLIQIFEKKNSFSIVLGFLLTSFILFFVCSSIMSLMMAGFAWGSFDIYYQEIIQVLKFTFLQSFLSVFISFLIGLMIARTIIRLSWGGLEKFFLYSSSVAFTVPTVVAGLGIIKIWGGSGLLSNFMNTVFGDMFFNLYGLPGILLAHTFFNIPLYLRVFYNCFSSVKINSIKVATQLNISGWNYFKIIEWPAIRSATPLISGIVFLQCFTSFALVLMLGGGPSASTLEVAIYTAIRFDFNLNSAAVLSIIQIVICCIVLIIFRSIDSKNHIFSQINSQSNSRKLFSHENILFRILNFYWILIFFLLILMPLIAVIFSGFNNKLDIIISYVFIRSLLTSVSIALISSVIAIFFSLILVIARTNLLINVKLNPKIYKTQFVKVFDIINVLYLAIPSIVLGVGIFVLLIGKINYTILPIIILIISNVLMCLPFTINIIQSKYFSLNEKHDRLCSSLGIKGLNRLFKVDLPAMKPELGFAAGLSACLSIGDLSVIALFGNQNFQTLPWLMYQFMSSYKMKEAAVISLSLLLICYTFFYFFDRIFKIENA